MPRLIIAVGLLMPVLGFATDCAYTPMCFKTNPTPPKKNLVLVLSGNGLNPYKLDSQGRPYNPQDATFSVGYMRILKPDLALGITIDGNVTGLSGFKLGFGYLFGD